METMKKQFLTLIAGAVLLGACGGGGTEVETDVATEDNSESGGDGLTIEIVAENLEAPWAVDFLDGVFYITERSGSMVHLDGEDRERFEIRLSEEISNAPEGGLLGFTLAPDFEETGRAYAYYTYENTKGQFNRVAALILDEDRWVEENVLLDEIPSGPVHHGGRLAIGPDDHLYITTGDAGEAELAQEMDSLAGKILRMTLDGEIPPDNPDASSYIYSYGHRNPQGLAWDEEGNLYSSEHGDNTNDEVNMIEPGENYGWPIIEGMEERESMTAPLFTSGDDTWAPSGMAVHDGMLYVAALRGNAVIAFDTREDKKEEVVTGLGRIRDVVKDDEYLYFISNNTDGRGEPDDTDDKLYRIPLAEFE